jgi:hypothetical protein
VPKSADGGGSFADSVDIGAFASHPVRNGSTLEDEAIRVVTDVPWTFASNLDGFTSTQGSWVATVVKIVATVLALVVFAIKGIDHVDQGERALKRRFGRVLFDRKGHPKEIGPGLKVLVPFVHSLLKISVRQRVEQLGTQTRRLEDGTGYQEVIAKIIFSVVNIHPALLVGEDLNAQIVALCEKHFRLLIGEGVANADIPDLLVERVTAEAARLGVQVDELDIVNEADTFATQLAQSFAAIGGGAVMAALNGTGTGHVTALRQIR